MVIDICSMGNHYERFLKLSAIEEAGLDKEQYKEVVEQIEEREGKKFRIPRSLRFSDENDKTPRLSDRYRQGTLLLNFTLRNLTKDKDRKRELLEDKEILKESILEFRFCEGALNSGFPLCDYLQEKYLQIKSIGGII